MHCEKGERKRAREGERGGGGDREINFLSLGQKMTQVFLSLEFHHSVIHPSSCPHQPDSMTCSTPTHTSLTVATVPRACASTLILKTSLPSQASARRPCSLGAAAAELLHPKSPANRLTTWAAWPAPPGGPLPPAPLSPLRSHLP